MSSRRGSLVVIVFPLAINRAGVCSIFMRGTQINLLREKRVNVLRERDLPRGSAPIYTWIVWIWMAAAMACGPPSWMPCARPSARAASRPATRLPSSRTLAADLAIARNTVADAYADLVAEGWLTSRQGSGTRVARRAEPRRARRAAWHGSCSSGPRRPGRPAPYNLLPGSPDLASFPRAQWLKAARRALTSAPYEALGYGDPRGRVELRTALAGYLSRARGVRADPERILICAGFAHGLRLLGSGAAGARRADGRRRGVRPPPVPGPAGRGRAAHPPLPFDEDGTDPGEFARQARARSCSPPPTSSPWAAPCTADRRAAVVDWARATGGLVLEDDYDGEFRYDRQPVGALQGLDPDRVVYFGTASKSLAPGLRFGWMVLPRS